LKRIKPLHILVVDDEFLIAYYLEELLQEAGCTVVGPVSDVGAAVSLIEKADVRIDGAFLDVNLRGESAYPVADALTKRKVPFIFITGYAAQGIDARYGAALTLAKPFDSAAIQKAVKRFE
jgi:CheY-like chemotaxis protein